jgi:glucose-1-phosphate adenylyltransferase
VEILAAEQTHDRPDWFQGTADAVRQMLPHLRDWRVDTLLILSGDHLYRMDYREFLARHFDTAADVTIAVNPCGPEEAEGFGLLKTDEDGRIVEFKEKPKGDALASMRVDTTRFGLTASDAAAKPFLASMGIYVFNYQKLVELLSVDEGEVDFGGEIIPAAINKYTVQAHLFKGYWEDIGTIQAFYKANLDLCAPLPEFNFFDTQSPIYTRSRYLPPSKLNDCDVEHSMISEGCILNGVKIRQSIIGLRSRIDENTEIVDSIVMGSDFFESLGEISWNINHDRPHIGIGHGSVIRRCILDKNVRIGQNVKLVNKDNLQNADDPEGRYFIRDGIIIVPKGSTVPDGTEI